LHPNKQGDRAHLSGEASWIRDKEKRLAEALQVASLRRRRARRARRGRSWQTPNHHQLELERAA